MNEPYNFYFFFGIFIPSRLVYKEVSRMRIGIQRESLFPVAFSIKWWRERESFCNLDEDQHKWLSDKNEKNRFWGFS